MKILQKLSSQQQDFFKDCIRAAFDNSASAFAKFINKEVKITSMAIISDADTNSDLVSEDIYILISELKGGLRGKCYLNFTYTDAKSLFQFALPPAYMEDVTMQKALLLELDNILTAAVISILSNTLKINTYAYVPELFMGDNDDLDKLLSQDFTEEKLILQFKTGFSIENHGLESEFIWVFDEALLDMAEFRSVNVNNN